MIQTAVVSGTFLVHFLGRKSRPAGAEDSYSRDLSSSSELDLLNPDSRKALQQRRSVPHPRQPQLLVEIQTPREVSSLVATAFRPVSSLDEVRVPESVSELIENLQQAQRTPKFTEPSRHPAFLRLPRALGEASMGIIGEHGVRRYEEFKRYHSGWDYGRGERLSPRSVTTLESFVEQLPELAAYEPSLFLTHQGNLQLGWEDARGNVVEMEFFSDKIEYYIESLNEEGSVGLEALHQLANKVKSTR